MVKTDNLDIFEVLMNFHYKENYMKMRNTIINGRVTDPTLILNYLLTPNNQKTLESLAGEGVSEGSTEVDTKGFLIFSNGATLIDVMKKDGIVKEENILESAAVENNQLLLDYLRTQKNPDGAYVIDTDNNKAAKVLKFSNEFDAMLEGKRRRYSLERAVITRRIKALDLLSKIPLAAEPIENRKRKLEERLESVETEIPTEFKNRFPRDFIYRSGDIDRGTRNRFRNVDYRAMVGLKTKLACALPQLYPKIHGYQIKRTSYANLGLGVVTHFDNGGLKERFYMIHAPGAKVFLDPTKKILGIYERFGHVRGDSRPKVRERLMVYSDDAGNLQRLSASEYHGLAHPETHAYSHAKVLSLNEKKRARA